MLEIDKDGNRFWKNEKDELHRVEGPAIEWSDGEKCWYRNEWLHRIDGPAIEYRSGTKEWYENDQLHRIDGPAVEWALVS